MIVWKRTGGSLGRSPGAAGREASCLGVSTPPHPPLPLELKNAPSNKCTHIHKGGVHTYHVCIHTRRLPSSYGPPAHGGNYGHIVGTSWFQFGRSTGVLTSLFMSPPPRLFKQVAGSEQTNIFLFVLIFRGARWAELQTTAAIC